MDKSLKSIVSDCRRRLENPYAHIEYLEDFEMDGHDVHATASDNQRISASRKLLENPYAHLDGHGRFSAGIKLADKTPMQTLSEQDVDGFSSRRGSTAARRYTIQEIEAAARKLQSRLWVSRQKLWDGAALTNPIDVLDIRKALGLVGYKLKYEDGLGRYRGGTGQIEVAGLIDRDAKLVKVSRQFLPTVQAFTLAHELGHAVLHNAGGGVHRDRPLDGVTRSRDPVELEADKFATYFLMPGKLVRERFNQLFMTDSFVLTDDTAFALCTASIDDVREELRTRRDFSRRLASTERYNSFVFKSLATQFKVSVEAMAIRLEELDLVGD